MRVRREKDFFLNPMRAYVQKTDQILESLLWVPSIHEISSLLSFLSIHPQEDSARPSLSPLLTGETGIR